MDGVISPPITRFKWDYGGTLSTFMPPYLHILPSPCLHCVNYIYISMPGPVGWKIQVKTKGCRYCMPQYKHNLIIVTGRRYRPNIKGELLSFLHSHVCISFSHPLYLSRWVGCVVTPTPPPKSPPTPSFFASEFYEAIQYFSNARLFTQSIKDQVFISFICFYSFLTWKGVFFNTWSARSTCMYRH